MNRRDKNSRTLLAPSSLCLRGLCTFILTTTTTAAATTTTTTFDTKQLWRWTLAEPVVDTLKGMYGSMNGSNDMNGLRSLLKSSRFPKSTKSSARMSLLCVDAREHSALIPQLVALAPLNYPDSPLSRPRIFAALLVRLV